MPRLRMQVAKLVLKDGWSTHAVARYSGFNQSTIVRWVYKARLSNRLIIPTKSSRPHSHSKALPVAVAQAILDHRHKYHRCAEVIHHQLKDSGYIASLSSVKRILKRNGLTYPSPWKKWHKYPPRPLPEKPGILVQIDTMFDGMPADRLCTYALLDICTRWAYVEPVIKINAQQSLHFIQQAQYQIPFSVCMVQSDHGSEFPKWFTKQLLSKGISHRHSRVRRPTDNGHIERFIRTLQQECLNRTSRTFNAWQRAIPEFLHYYNTERPHMGLNMRTPLEMMQSY